MRNNNFEQLACKSEGELEAIMRSGNMPDKDALAGWEYDEWISSPLAKIIGKQKFRKGFLIMPDSSVKGYNSIMKPGELNDLWVYKLNSKGTINKLFFDVYPAIEGGKSNLYPNALLFNYNTGKNNLVEKSVRDYVVQAEPGKNEVLLGKMYFLLDDIAEGITQGKAALKSGKHIGGVYFMLRKAERISSALESEIKARMA
ncbi:MAG: hypothetical protein PHO02_07300 [Candidatus Nanoarchaeia archaeon]|nr:hypothetical protein [Candidatus Nanoarchaeia archaeon]